MAAAGKDLPEDAVEISEEIHALLLQGQSEGQTIRPDAQGNPILAPHVPLTPRSVSMFQARVALRRAGLLGKVQPALDAMPDGDDKEDAKLAWEWAGAVERASPFVALLATALVLDDAAVDELFQAASLVP